MAKTKYNLSIEGATFTSTVLYTHAVVGTVTKANCDFYAGYEGAIRKCRTGAEAQRVVASLTRKHGLLNVRIVPVEVK